MTLQTSVALSPTRSPVLTPVNSSRNLLLSAHQQSPLGAQVTLEDLKAQFTRWMHTCLTDDLARHVHDVARNDYIFKGM